MSDRILSVGFVNYEFWWILSCFFSATTSTLSNSCPARKFVVVQVLIIKVMTEKFWNLFKLGGDCFLSIVGEHLARGFFSGHNQIFSGILASWSFLPTWLATIIMYLRLTGMATLPIRRGRSNWPPLVSSLPWWTSKCLSWPKFLRRITRQKQQLLQYHTCFKNGFFFGMMLFSCEPTCYLA